MAQHDTAHAETDHDEHGHGPSSDGPYVGVALVVLAILFALGVGRHVPQSPSAPEEGDRYEAIVVMQDGHELRGRVHEEGDLISIMTARGETMLHRSHVASLERVDVSARPPARGVVVLHSGQVFVGPLEHRADGVQIDGILVPTSRIRWMRENGTGLSDDYWRQYASEPLDTRYHRADEQSARPRPSPSVAARPTPVRAPDPITTPAPSPSVDPQAAELKRLVLSADELRAGKSRPDEEAELWRQAYEISKKPLHLRGMREAVEKWYLSPGGVEAYPERLERFEEIVEPVREVPVVQELRSRVYFDFFQKARQHGGPAFLGFMRTLRDKALELDPNAVPGVEALQTRLSTDFELLEAAAQEPEEPGHEGHGHGPGEHQDDPGTFPPVEEPNPAPEDSEEKTPHHF